MLGLWAVLGVPLIFSGYVEWSYVYSLERSSLPYAEIPEFIWYIMFILSMLSGATAVYFLPRKNKTTKFVSAIAYIPIMALALLYLHFVIACSNGDCL